MWLAALGCASWARSKLLGNLTQCVSSAPVRVPCMWLRWRGWSLSSRWRMFTLQLMGFSARWHQKVQKRGILPSVRFLEIQKLAKLSALRMLRPVNMAQVHPRSLSLPKHPNLRRLPSPRREHQESWQPSCRKVWWSQPLARWRNRRRRFSILGLIHNDCASQQCARCDHMESLQMWMPFVCFYWFFWAGAQMIPLTFKQGHLNRVIYT